MKKAARIAIILLAVLFALIAALAAFGPLTHKTQNAKNLLVLADMKDRVQAVREFQRQNERLPSKEELAGLSSALPVRYFRYDYYIETSKVSHDPDYPQDWPATGGWVLSFWRGEWWEYYSSWDDRYTLSKQLTAWDGYGFPLAVAIGLVLLSRVSFLQNRKKQPPNKRTTDNSEAAPLRV
jgi:hypothetical protein